MSAEKTEKKVYPGHSDEAHPEVFNTMPPMKYPLKPGQLSEEKLKQYFRDVCHDYNFIRGNAARIQNTRDI